jgi:hypothetical protein
MWAERMRIRGRETRRRRLAAAKSRRSGSARVWCSRAAGAPRPAASVGAAVSPAGCNSVSKRRAANPNQCPCYFCVRPSSLTCVDLPKSDSISFECSGAASPARQPVSVVFSLLRPTFEKFIASDARGATAGSLPASELFSGRYRATVLLIFHQSDPYFPCPSSMQKPRRACRCRFAYV